MVDKLNTLARLVARAFYEDKHCMVIEYLINENYADDITIAKKLQAKDGVIRAALNDLRADFIIDVHQIVESKTTAGTIQKEFYRFYWARFLMAVKYKVFMVRSTLEQEAKLIESNEIYFCPKCVVYDDRKQPKRREYSVHEMIALFEKYHEEVCGACGSALEKDTRPLEEAEKRKGMGRLLMSQVDRILQLLKEAEKLNLPDPWVPEETPAEGSGRGKKGEKAEASPEGVPGASSSHGLGGTARLVNSFVDMPQTVYQLDVKIETGSSSSSSAAPAGPQRPASPPWWAPQRAPSAPSAPVAPRPGQPAAVSSTPSAAPAVKQEDKKESVNQAVFQEYMKAYLKKLAQEQQAPKQPAAPTPVAAASTSGGVQVKLELSETSVKAEPIATAAPIAGAKASHEDGFLDDEEFGEEEEDEFETVASAAPKPVPVQPIPQAPQLAFQAMQQRMSGQQAMPMGWGGPGIPGFPAPLPVTAIKREPESGGPRMAAFAPQLGSWMPTQTAPQQPPTAQTLLAQTASKVDMSFPEDDDEDEFETVATS